MLIFSDVTLRKTGWAKPVQSQWDTKNSALEFSAKFELEHDFSHDHAQTAPVSE